MINKNVIIVGCGIAGMTSAIYLKRAGIDVTIIEANAPGGQLLSIKTIENYPGFKSIEGPNLAYQLYEQITSLNIPLIIDEVVKIENDNTLKIVTTLKNKYKCCGVIIATGRVTKSLGLENESKFRGKGLSFCATCDGALYKNLDICILGTNKEDIEYLENICKTVTILNPMETCDYKENSKIRVINNAEVTSLNGNELLESIEVNNKIINTSALFINLDSIPSVTFLKPLNLDMKNNYLIVNQDMKTNIAGVYAIGDVVKKSLYQLVTAASEGAIAAVSMRKYLKDTFKD